MLDIASQELYIHEVSGVFHVKIKAVLSCPCGHHNEKDVDTRIRPRIVYVCKNCGTEYPTDIFILDD